ncbi:hypothetical protein C8R46DRAFT_1104363 [Mycena filopes]|nr:hypothetical protein C8R46DRAFT_1104363 [Mycena filopes]
MPRAGPPVPGVGRIASKSPSRPRFTEVNEELRTRALHLDSDIAELCSRLEKLLVDRAVVQEGLDAISYPVLTLPFEIISKIFRSTLGPREPKPSASSALASQLTSLRLGHICRLWRQIALTTRELWNSFDVDLHSPSSRMLEARQSLTRTFLSRAASSPLHFSLAGDANSFRTMLDILVPHSRTWANVSLDFPGIERIEALQSIHHQLPVLNSLTLTLGPVPEDAAFGNMFNDAPLLRNVYISGFGSQPSALPWSRLTFLSLDEFSGPDFAEILGWTPNLVYLVVGAVWEDIPRILPLAHLQSVIIVDGLHVAAAAILAVLDAQIRELKLCMFADLAPLSPPMLHPASLERLSVDVVGRAGEDEVEVPAPSIEFLTTMSGLRILKIVAHDYDPPSTNFSLAPLVLRLLEDPAFLPKLESLTLILLYPFPPDSASQDSFADAPSELDIPVDSLSNMLCARFPQGLRHFELRSRRPVHTLDRRAMDLRAKGMKIILETEPTLEIAPWREEF